ncbi:Flavonoid 3'-monooxygenase [Acorus calamus]|uniref:Flavonoid 3'-monooxygenase n=1 Tax=Acorus calamus TaxID=4465 RepID=A0AAV9ELC5_ACOCL|nr:Flavonoid 3'-monooxygenase [Acorus calamus]
MDRSSLLLYASTALLISLSLLILRRRLGPRLPPGPRPWPIIGNFNLIGALPHRSIDALSKIYGPIMRIHFGSRPIVVASSVDMAKKFLTTHDLNFSSRPKTAAGKYTTYNYSDITWSPYGPYWQQARKMCVLELFSAERLASYEYIRTEETRSMLRSIAKCSGREIMLKDPLSTLSLNVISRMVLGKRYLDEQEEESIVSPEEFKKMLDELFLLNGVLNIGDWIPCIDFLDLQGYVRRMKALARKFDAFLERVLDEHIENRRKKKAVAAEEEEEGAADKDDMVDVLLRLAEDPNLKVQLKRDGVKGFTQDLIAGGTESSAVTVEWAISELLRKPHIFKRATEELDRVIGKDRWVEEKDMRSLPYVEAIVKETMRMHPVAPMLVPRMSQRDCTVDGYDIPGGTGILVNVWTIGRDPSVWDSPEEFRPERFVGQDVDVKGHDFQLLPFGAGRRMCPGYSLGLKVIQLSLANLLHGFEWRLPEGLDVEELNMEEIFGLSTPRKYPLVAVAEPRLPEFLYEGL